MFQALVWAAYSAQVHGILLIKALLVSQQSMAITVPLPPARPPRSTYRYLPTRQPEFFDYV